MPPDLVPPVYSIQKPAQELKLVIHRGCSTGGRPSLLIVFEVGDIKSLEFRFRTEEFDEAFSDRAVVFHRLLCPVD
jgi:hypothetical protein